MTPDQRQALIAALVRTEVRDAISIVFKQLEDDEIYTLRETPDAARDCALRLQGIDIVRARFLEYMRT